MELQKPYRYTVPIDAPFIGYSGMKYCAIEHQQTAPPCWVGHTA